MAVRRAWDSDTELLDNGFSTTEEGVQEDTLPCPHCGVEINGEEDVTITGDSILCKKCGRSIMDIIGDTANTPENDESINRREWGEAWDEMLDFDAMDYETDN